MSGRSVFRLLLGTNDEETQSDIADNVLLAYSWGVVQVGDHDLLLDRPKSLVEIVLSPEGVRG